MPEASSGTSTFRLRSIKKSIEREIFDEEIWIGQNMWRVAEVTYSYNSSQTLAEEKIDINTTLFCDIGEMDLRTFSNLSDKEKVQSLQKATIILKQKLKDKKDKINIYLERINKIPDTAEAFMLKNALVEKRRLITYCQNGIPYELEKAGTPITITDEERTRINEHQKKLDRLLFGGEITDNPQEVTKCYEKLKSILKENKKNINKEEKKKFKEFIEKLMLYLPHNYKSEKFTPPKSLLKKYKKFEIEDSYYIPGFNMFIEAVGGLKHIATQSNVGSISDGPQGIEFPKSKKFKTIALDRMLKLNAHEIETHSITDHNHSQIFGRLRLEKSTEKDEGLAILMEHLLEFGRGILVKDPFSEKYILDESKFQVTNGFINICMGEVLNNQDFFTFLKIKEKLTPGKTSPRTSYLRVKRMNDRGVQHKDCSYIRGLFRAILEINLYIKSGGEKGIKPEDLFLGKVGFDEMADFKKLKQEKEAKGTELQIVMPIFASDAILYFLDHVQEEDEIDEEGFLEYLKYKYPIFNFKEKTMKLISHKTKSNLSGVLDVVWKNICGENKNFILMLENTISKLSSKRKKVVKKYIKK